MVKELITRWGLVIALIFALGFGIFAWGQYSKYREAIDTAKAAVSGLRIEKERLVVEAEKLTEELRQARTVTTGKEQDLKDAMGDLRLSEKVRADLERILKGRTPDAVGTTTATIEVHDTVAVAVTDSGWWIDTEWLAGEYRGGVFDYTFLAEFYYNHITVIGDRGERRTIENAYIKSPRSGAEKNIPVFSSITTRRPERLGVHLNPTFHVGISIPSPEPAIGVSIFSIGTTTEGSQVIISLPTIGFTMEKTPDVMILPLSVNAGHFTSLFHSLHVGAGVFYGRDGATPGVFISGIL
jgi:hypothetical protein